MASNKSRARSSRPQHVSQSTRSRVTSPIITVRVPLPVTLAVRKVSYTYPLQKQLRKRTIRVPIHPLRNTRYVNRTVQVRIPRRLPRTVGSYVSIGRNHTLNIHSARQTHSLLEREYNRRRYSEWKRRRRKARDGQLDSVRRDVFGIIGEAARRGYGPDSLAEAALVTRALGG